MYRIIFLFLLFLAACSNNTVDEKRITAIGTSIMHADTSGIIRPDIPDVVYLDDKLIRSIPMLQRAGKDYRIIVKEGDMVGAGAGEADCVLRILTDSYGIAIRLKYNSELKKYEILGWAQL